ncbi:MAG: FAD-dependent oxidoreductase [Bacteroidota bacterium]
MTRKEFLKMCGVLGVGFPAQAMLSSCEKETITTNGSINKVIVIGAGAAGLASAYLLTQQGIEVQILEASSTYGGRMKTTRDFASFPIPLGAEWLHVERGVFDEIVNDDTIQVNINTTPYDPSVDYALYEGAEVSLAEVGFTIDQKFVNATWFDFFDEYIVPSVASQIAYNKVIESVDYSGDQVVVKTADEEFTADRVIVSVPVKILQRGTIRFKPALSGDKQEAIENVTVWDGCKAFIAFSENFYPAFTAFDITPETAGQKLYYDAAYGQDTTEHIMGLFAVGIGATPYLDRSANDSDLIEFMLNELDEIYNGQASTNYIKHTFQNWNAEPHIGGAYVYDQEDWRRLRALGESVDNKLFFAGDAYTTGSDWGSVHAAARSARRATEELVG